MIHLTDLLRKHSRISKGALKRSSSTKLPEINPQRHHLVVTLDPKKFAEKKQRRLNIGNLQSFRPSIALHNRWSPVTAQCGYASSNSFAIYPPDTKAFLYYLMSPERPRIAGELRLRVTPSDDPASFNSGFDLLRSNGQPWSRSLFMLSNCYIHLYEKLREEQLVSDDLDTILSTLPRRLFRCQHLYTLNDPFILDFSVIVPCFLVITEQGTKSLRFRGPFIENRPTISAPYTGAYTNHQLLLLLD